MSDVVEYNEIIFESIKRIDNEGNEYWLARELQKVLEYKEWRKFEGVIVKAKEACLNSEKEIEYHFVGVDKMVEIGSNTERKISDYELSRYACYLIVQNADPRKEVVALGQTYFAVQTRKQELNEKEYLLLTEDERRLYQRSLTKKGNYSLNQAAVKSGVKNLAEFHNAGYKGLYNGETANDIFKRKGLRYRQDILDNMREDELVANLFRINQTKQRLEKDNILGEKEAKDVHYEVGKKVRKAIIDIGGTLPEDMPTPIKDIKELEKTKRVLESKEMSKLKNNNP